MEDVLSIEKEFLKDLEALDSNIKAFNSSSMGLEVITEASETLWETTSNNLNKTKRNLTKYHEAVFVGVTRLSEELKMLSNVANDIKNTKPIKPIIKLGRPIRFVVNGKFDPDNVRPLLSEFQNLLNFNDKILLNLSDIVIELLRNVRFDDKFLVNYNADLTRLQARGWLTGTSEIDPEKDTRFKKGQAVHKGATFNNNRAIYYVGPNADLPSEFESERHKWTMSFRVLSNIRFKCLNDPEAQLLNKGPIEHTVSNLMSIKQRANILSGILKRLSARKREINKHLDNIDKLMPFCQDIMNAAKKVKPLVDKEDHSTKPHPSENRVFVESLALYRNTIRMTFDYYNAIAIFLRLMGSQAYLIDTEIKAYMETPGTPNKERE